VTFPAYAGATSGMRSMTDEFLLACFRSDPDRLRAMFDQATSLEVRDAAPEGTSRDEPAEEAATAPSSTDAAPQEGTSGPESRDTRRKGRYGLTQPDQRPSWAL
jgi:hypothetical protein